MKAQDAGKYADIMAQTMSSSNTTIELMGETMKYAGAVAGGLGISMEDLSLAIGTMANAGIKGSMSGTALRGGLTRLIAPTEKAEIQMKKYGIEVKKTENGNVDYLALEAMLIYENAQNRNNIILLRQVTNKFEEVVKKSNNALYWNYYGYLLIDHSLDIKKGMQCVQEALKQEPKNPYFLDSLAWGYYKLNDCKNAQIVIGEIAQEDIQKEKEISAFIE